MGLTCPLCAGARTEVRFRAADCNFGSGAEVEIAECSDCRLGFVHPLPTDEEMAARYRASYRELTAPGFAARLFFHFYSRFVRLTKRLPASLPATGLAVLDVGCHRGEFLAGLRHRHRVYGVETTPPLAAAAGAALGADRVYAGCFEEYDGRFGPMDVITMFAVLEHSRDPLQMLAVAAASLKPGGVLVVEVPNWDCRERRQFGRHWGFLAAPLHLFHFSPAAVRSLAARAGLTVVAERDQPWHPFVFTGSVLNRWGWPRSYLAKVFLTLALAPLGIGYNLWQAGAGGTSVRTYDLRRAAA